ncbi:MAG: protease complex subunit PrcB family protein [Acidobacteria bacterium]|nr:protease complex subunit PrcB family protein [Acidobacteriota bacterium]
MRNVSAILVALQVLLPAVVAQAFRPADALRTIAKGDQSHMDDAKQAVARTEAEWTALWQQHSPDRRRPAVDFSKEMVVGVFLGSRPTAGYQLEILSAAPDGAAFVVRYRQMDPPPGAVTAQVITSYYHLVAVPKTSATVRFEKLKTEK